jgi:NodT family efflux transporter outer membrane factor (OMF) lipoprotein
MNRSPVRRLNGARILPLVALLALGGCAVTAPPATVPVATPAAWQAPLPHGGQTGALQDWWRQWNDPLLSGLIDAAQQASPGVAAAQARVAAAQAARVAAGAARGPTVDASLAAARATTLNPGPGGPPATSGQAGVAMAWELDLWGGVAAAAEAAEARLSGSSAQWHDARVAVAAEVARELSGWRWCRQVLASTRADADSRAEAARLTALKARAGLEAPAAAALLDASAAQGRADAVAQAQRCDAAVKALVALTAQDEPALRRQLESDAAAPGPRLLPPPPVPPQLPAQLLAQRPDLRAAQAAVAAAAADAGAAEADRYPRLGLSGAIGRSATRGAGGDGTTWSVGPLALSLPLADGGRRAASARAARAGYDAAVVQLQAEARVAVREVEQALLALDSAAARRPDAARAADGFRRAAVAAQARQQAGLGSALEREDARRAALAAELAELALRHEERLAAIDLYRALGGGWQDGKPSGRTPPNP